MLVPFYPGPNETKLLYAFGRLTCANSLLNPNNYVFQKPASRAWNKQIYVCVSNKIISEFLREPAKRIFLLSCPFA